MNYAYLIPISIIVLIPVYSRIKVDKLPILAVVLALPTGFFGSVAAYLIYIYLFFLRKRAELYNNVKTDMSDGNVILLMNHIQKHGVINHPKYWNELRSVWFLINESNKITSDVKTAFREVATGEGLKINMQERKIIDNYVG